MLYLLLIVLVIASGFIAYWGDLLGRRMGKRRLTLFGLRPKYTAIVVTTITGMIIAGLTLAILLLCDRGLYKMLLNGHQIMSDNATLTSDKAALSKSISDLHAQETDLRARANDAVRRTTQAEKKLLLAEDKSKRLQLQVQKASVQLVAVESSLNATAAQLAEAKTTLADTRAKQQVAQKSYEYARDVAGKLLQRLGEFSSKSVIAQSGEEVARKTVRPSALAARDIDSLLGMASKVMGDRGAAVSKISGRYIYVWGVRNEKQYIQAKSKDLLNRKKEVVIVARAFLNTVKGEPVPVIIELKNNELAFRNGEVIASTTMDGSRSQVQVLISLMEFMQTRVRKAAKDADMIPTYDPDAPQPTYVAIPWLNLVAVAEDINRANGRALVRLVAKQDIKSGDTMNLSNIAFDVTPSSVRAGT